MKMTGNFFFLSDRHLVTGIHTGLSFLYKVNVDIKYCGISFIIDETSLIVKKTLCRNVHRCALFYIIYFMDL